MAGIGRLELAGLACIVLVVLALGAFACSGPEERIAFLFYDDAYYYLGVARNLSHGVGSTFDGINQTNGYHPLWCLLLVPIFLALEDPGAAVRVAGVFWFLLAAAAPVVLWWAIRPRSGPAAAWIAAVLFGLHPYVAMSLARPNGLETPLYALLLALAAGAWERSIRPGRTLPGVRATAGMGVLIGLAVLARLDAGALAIAAALLLLSRGATRLGGRGVWGGAVGRAVVLASAATAVAGPFLLWSAVRFGSPMPVSGRMAALEAVRERETLGGPRSPAFLRRRAGYALRAIPSAFAQGVAAGTPGERWIARRRRLLAPLALVAGAGLVVLALRQRARAGALSRDALALLALTAAIHAAAYAGWIWMPGEERYRLYYFMPQALVLAASIGALVGPGLARLVRLPVARAVTATLMLAILGWHAVSEARGHVDAIAARSGPLAHRYIYGWIRRNLPEGAVIGARDAGKLGFFSGRPVVNLDGLINDDRFHAAVRDDLEPEYVCSSPIGYLLYDRPWIGGYDASRPHVQPRSDSPIGHNLWRLHALPGCDLRDVPVGVADWVAIEVVRPPRPLASPPEPS